MKTIGKNIWDQACDICHKKPIAYVDYETGEKLCGKCAQVKLKDMKMVNKGR